MSNLQTTLDSLQPYVIGIRYLKGVPLVDVVLNDGWTVVDDPMIKRVKGDDTMNYHMIFSEEPGIGLDELLAYVDKIIKANLDREKKHELLKAKVNELKEIFKRNSLTKLQRLRFNFGEDEEFNTNITDIDIDDEPSMVSTTTSTHKIETPVEEEINEIEETLPTQEPVVYLDENKQPITLSAEDKELLAEEARAERNRKVIEAKKRNAELNPASKKIELPPKRKLEMATPQYHGDCDCGPDEACSKCMDSKDL